MTNLYPPIPHLDVSAEVWPLARSFAISRGTKTEARVVVAEVSLGALRGRGECVPYTHYGESVEQTVLDLESLRDEVARGLSRDALLIALPPGAARNALDCALWDLAAKRDGIRAWELIEDIDPPGPTLPAETIGIDTPDAMGEAACRIAGRPLIKVKLDGKQVMERMQAVRAAAPDARLIVDANEGWTLDILNAVADPLGALGVEMIEQPLPAMDDAALDGYCGAVLLSADESVKDLKSLQRLPAAYGMVNIKLDKAGGLTEALLMARDARQRGWKIMIGCMVGTSLGMAPAMALASFAEYVDLDGPLWLAKDRADGLTFKDGYVHPPEPGLWG